MKFQLKDFQATFRNSQNPFCRNPRAVWQNRFIHGPPEL